MDFDETIIEKILKSNPKWVIKISEKQFTPYSVSVEKTMIPVKKPSTRGGVYFSETEAYKVKCLIDDNSVVSLLTSTMLGPNTDFTPIPITASIDESKYVILANLTNYVQTKDNVQLSLVVVDVTN